MDKNELNEIIENTLKIKDTCNFCGCEKGCCDSEECCCTGCCFGDCSECDEQC